MSDDAVVVVGTMIAVVLTAFFLWVWIQRSPRSRLVETLRNTSVTDISRAVDGQLVKFCGTLEVEGEPLVSPLTGRACAYYHTTVKDWGTPGGYRVMASIRHNERDQCTRLWIDDGTGRALVVMNYGVTVLTVDTHRSTGPELDAIMERHGESRQGVFFAKELRGRESALEIGKPVAVYGCCKRTPEAGLQADSDGSSHNAAGLCVVKTTEGELVLSQDPTTFG